MRAAAACANLAFFLVAGQILPGSTIGIFGSGQLGRMLAFEARKMGYRVHVFSPDSDSPTGQIADREYTGDYSDLSLIHEFARGVDVITFEFENVPSAAVEAAAEHSDVFPGDDILHICQDRIREKNFLSQHGFPVTPYRPVRSLDDLEQAVAELGLPAVLKTAGFGYDGKGQVKINAREDVADAFGSLNGAEAVLEAFVDFEKEASVVCARGRGGEFAHFGVIENGHANHILDISTAPGDLPRSSADAAIEIARSIAEQAGYVGTLCVEFFVLGNGDVVVNEIAPRPHNSGHLTIEACVTSQFEQQLRAVCGLPLGSTEFYAPAAMANLLGDLWGNGEPNWNAALSDPAVKLHLYGKAEPKPGRKMGHLIASAPTAQAAAEIVRSARERLTGS